MTPRAQHARSVSTADEVRPYREGDDPAWIDWELTATQGQTMVRVPAPGGPGLLDRLRAADPLLNVARVGGVALVGTAAYLLLNPGSDDSSSRNTQRDPGATVTRTATTPAKPPAAPRRTGNLLANPSFERGVAGWRAIQGTLSRVRVPRAPSGAHAARLVAARRAPVVLAQARPVAPGGWPRGARITGRISVRAAANPSTGDLLVLRVLERSRTGRLLSTTSARPVRLTTRFHPVTVTTRLLAPGSLLELRATVRRRAGARIARATVLADAATLRVTR